MNPCRSAAQENVIVLLESGQIEKLNEIAKKAQTQRSAIIRQAVEIYLHNYAKN